MRTAGDAGAFHLEDIRFSAGDPSNLGTYQYRALYGFAVEAFMAGMTPRRTQEEVNFMLGGSPAAFEETRKDPSTLNDKLDARPLTYGLPRIVVAQRQSEIVGYGYAANQTSGNSPMRRRLKSFLPSHRWAWLREVAVDNNAPAGLGTVLGALLLDGFKRGQNASAYTWRENPVGARFVESLGFMHTPDDEPRMVHAFSASQTSVLHRWTGNVGEIMAHIVQKPGAKDALERARTFLNTL
jgi:hypothetical protein